MFLLETFIGGLGMYFWYSNGSCVTGRALAMELGLTRRSANDKHRQYGTLPPPVGTRKALVWGGKYPMTLTGARDRRLHRTEYINNIFKLETYRNKAVALTRMRECGVPVPKFTTDKYKVFDDLKFPVIGRTTQHYAGSGFKYYETEDDFIHDTGRRYSHFLEFVKTPREYRVHVFCDNIIRVSRKRPQIGEDGESVEPRTSVCRTHDNGWMFSLCDQSRVHASILEDAQSAINALGYDFGAVDILRHKRSNKNYVLEVNSAPGLDNSGLAIYADAIRSVM